VNIALEVMAEMGQSVDDSQEFFVMDLIIAFRRLQGFGVVSHGVRLSKSVFLFQDCSCSVITGIGDERKWFAIIRQEEYR